MRRYLALAVLWLGLLVAGTALASDKDIDVSVRVDGRRVRVDASFFVAASLTDVWAVMTDFDHFAEFISNLKSSRILARTGNVITVEQAGEAAVGPIKFPFESVREIRLMPFDSVLSKSVSGTLQEFEGQTRFLAEGLGTRVTYHSDAVSKLWIPPFVGSGFIERETREQLSEFQNEIARRQRRQGSGPR